MATKARYRRRKNPEVDGWIPCHAIRIDSEGAVQVLREVNPRRSNPTGFGFRDSAGVFHPIVPKEKYLKKAGKVGRKSKAKPKAKRKVKRSKARKKR